MLSRWRNLAGPTFDQQLTADTGEHGSVELVLNSNYKLAVETTAVYHLPFVHPDLNTYSPLDAHYNLTVDPLASGQGTRVYDLTRETVNRCLSFQSGIVSASKPWSTCPLPQRIAGHTSGPLLRHSADVEAVDQTRERLQFLYAETAATNEAYGARRQSLHAWSIVFAEDISVVEGMQRGRASPAFDGGLFAIMDMPTHHFHKWFLTP